MKGNKVKGLEVRKTSKVIRREKGKVIRSEGKKMQND